MYSSNYSPAFAHVAVSICMTQTVSVVCRLSLDSCVGKQVGRFFGCNINLLAALRRRCFRDGIV